MSPRHTSNHSTPQDVSDDNVEMQYAAGDPHPATTTFTWDLPELPSLDSLGPASPPSNPTAYPYRAGGGSHGATHSASHAPLAGYPDPFTWASGLHFTPIVPPSPPPSMPSRGPPVIDPMRTRMPDQETLERLDGLYTPGPSSPPRPRSRPPIVSVYEFLRDAREAHLVTENADEVKRAMDRYFPEKAMLPGKSAVKQGRLWLCQSPGCQQTLRWTDCKTHAMQHSGKKQFICSCGEGFKNRREIKKHHAEREICKQCPQRVGKGGSSGLCSTCLKNA